MRRLIEIFTGILCFSLAACATDSGAGTAASSSSTDSASSIDVDTTDDALADAPPSVDPVDQRAPVDQHTPVDQRTPDSSDATHDIGTTTDADPEQIPCESIKFAWSDFVKQHRSCVDSSECVYAGGSMNYCNCAIAIGDLGGDPIHRHAVPSTQPYLDRFEACRAAGHPFHCGYDHGPSKNLRCAAGICVADWQSCIVIDAGHGG